MLKKMKERWRLLTVRGYISLIIGIFFFYQPQMSIPKMLQLFAVFLLLSGISLVILGIMVENENKMLRIIESLLFLITAVMIYLNINRHMINVFIIVAVWAAINGIIEIFISFRLRKSLPDEWFLIMNGLISVLFALTNACGVFEGTSLTIIVFGTFSLLNGLFILFFAYRIRYIKIWK